MPTSSARVSVRLSFSLEDWASFSWTIEPPDLDIYNMSGDTDFIQLAKLPFGCVSDPIAGEFSMYFIDEKSTKSKINKVSMKSTYRDTA